MLKKNKININLQLLEQIIKSIIEKTPMVDLTFNPHIKITPTTKGLKLVLEIRMLNKPINIYNCVFSLQNTLYYQLKERFDLKKVYIDIRVI